MNKYFTLSVIAAASLLIVSCAKKTYKSLPARAPVKIQAEFADTSQLHLQNSITIGAKVTLNKKKKKTTKGFMDGTFAWKNFDVAVENGYFKEGVVSINRDAITPVNNKVKIFITAKKNKRAKDSLIVDIPYLQKIQIINNAQEISPGKYVPVSLVSSFSNGKVIPAANNVIHWQKMEIRSADFTFHNDQLTCIVTPDKWVDSGFDEVAYKYDTTIKTHLKLKIRYNNQYIIDGSGATGNAGYAGDRPSSYKRKGKNGRNGTDGHDGHDGEDGENVSLYLKTVIHGNDTLLKGYAKVRGQELIYFIQPDMGGKITVNCNGGSGGDGGDGGDGSRGERATALERPGYGGDGGDGGDGGRGGNGGQLVVYADSLAMKYLYAIKYTNEGGNGGAAGRWGKGGNGGDDIDPKTNKYVTSYGKDGRDGDYGDAGQKGRRGPDMEVKPLTVSAPSF